jgi:hypothetical protein
MKNKAAVALGRRGGKVTSPAKQKAARENGKKGGRPLKNWPEKRHTFDCTVPNCKATIPHEHI